MKMEVIHNNKRLDYNDNYKGILEDLILLQTKHFPFQSIETMKENFINLMTDLFVAFENEKEIQTNKVKKRELTSLTRKIENFIKAMRYKKTSNVAERTIYDFVLGLEGIGTLNGFGFCSKFGDKLVGDSERQSYSGIELIKQ
jgi:hypothetical protein